MLPRAEPNPAEIIVDLDAVADNFGRLVRQVSTAEVAAVVKADAYGLGAVRVARRLEREGCRTYWVSSLAEGRELRSQLPDARIFVLEGACGALAACREAGLVPVLNTPEEVVEWSAFAECRPAAIQFDTGMNRAGLDGATAVSLIDEQRRRGRLRIELLMTHLACADEAAHPMNGLQRARFDALRAHFAGVPASIANSAGIFLGRDYHADLVRPGLALYGGRPASAGENPMREVVRFDARVLQIRTLGEAGSVGYGATATRAKGSRIATIGAGYADGLPRALGNRGFALVQGRAVPIVGRVSMDLITLDVTGLPPSAVGVGDRVSVLGAGLSLEDVAEAAGTVSYEVLTRLSPRVARRYLGE
jgi:alanine racemase